MDGGGNAESASDWNQGRWMEAEKLFVQVMEKRKTVLEPEHPDTLTSMSNLASTYQYQRRWTEAEQLNVQVMETRKRVLGPEHPDTLTSMANLASTYREQGRWTEAEKLNGTPRPLSRRLYSCNTSRRRHSEGSGTLIAYVSRVPSTQAFASAYDHPIH
jgi:tetratricopeptide repeat protein